MFGNPLLLGALAALAVPLWLHLVVREERSGVGFPSLMFLRRIPFEQRRRRTLRDRALLALRCLAIALLALAFAGPQCRGEPPAAAADAPPRDSVLLLDRSYSMGAPERWAGLLAEARRRIDALSGGRRLALVAFDDTATLLAAPSADQGLLRARLASLEPGHGTTRIGTAFDLAGQLLRESPAAERAIVLVSDLQRSALAAVDRLQVDMGVTLEVVPVPAPAAANAAVTGVRLEAAGSGGQRLRVTLRNTGGAPLGGLPVTLELDGIAVHREQVVLPAGGAAQLDVPLVLAADRATPGRIVLGADALAADNTQHLVLLPERPIQLGMLLGAATAAEPGDASPSLFVEQALRLASNPSIHAAGLGEVPGDARLAAFDVLLVDDLALRERTLREQVERFTAAGGAVLLVPAEHRAAAPPVGLGALRTHAAPGLGVELVPLPGGASPWPGDVTALGEALADVRLLASRTLDLAAAPPGTRVLARLADGTPWLVERPTGEGVTLVMSGGLDLAWGNLVLQPGFVPLLHALVGHLARRSPAAPAQVRGTVLDLARAADNLPGGHAWRRYLAAGGHVIAELPGGRQQALPAGEILYRLDASGLYQLHRADGAGPVLPVAVNPDRDESQLAPAAVAELEQRVSRRTRPPERPPGPAAGVAGEERLPPGWYLLAAAALLLWLEALVANRLTWRRQAALERAP